MTVTNNRDLSCANCGRAIYAGTPHYTLGMNKFCCSKCENEYQQNKRKNQPKFSETLTGKATKGVGNLAGKATKGVGNLAGKGWSSFNNSLDEIKERNDNQKERIIEEAKQISKFEFSNNPNDLKNELEELLAMRATLKGEELPIKKAIYSKLEFGINRLKSQGEDISFYEEKVNRAKPSLWDKINGFISTN